MARKTGLTLRRERDASTHGSSALRGSSALAQNACRDCGIIRVAGHCGCAAPTRAFASAPPSQVPQNGNGNGNGNGHWIHGCNPDLMNIGVNLQALRRGMLQQFGDRREPYVDVKADCMDMDVLFSDITAGGAGGVETEIEIVPVRGSFVAFYYDIVVWTTADGEPEPNWTYRRPRIDGCPIPCDDLDKQIKGTFAQKVAEACCCGVPILAFLQKSAEDAPLVVPITIPELASAQVRLFGFCCSTRLC